MAEFNPDANNSGMNPDMFGQQAPAPEQPTGPDAEYSQIATLISDLDRRLRILEERYSNIRKKIQLTDQNLLESERSFSKELKEISDEALELKRSTGDFSDKISMFESEIDNVAQRMDLKVIEKYFNMWDPSSFVTRSELKEYLKDKKIAPGGK
jgi:chromosome segregation ATPase